MTALNLTKIAVAPASDLTAITWIETASSFSADKVTGGGVRTYGQGRRRSVTRRDQPQTWQIRAELDDADVALDLEDLEGQIVLVRMPSGRRMWGRLSGLTIDEVQGVDGSELVSFGFDVEQVTASEVV